jgi:hypothetical protein
VRDHQQTHTFQNTAPAANTVPCPECGDNISMGFISAASSTGKIDNLARHIGTKACRDFLAKKQKEEKEMKAKEKQKSFLDFFHPRPQIRTILTLTEPTPILPQPPIISTGSVLECDGTSDPECLRPKSTSHSSSTPTSQGPPPSFSERVLHFCKIAETLPIVIACGDGDENSPWSIFSARPQLGDESADDLWENDISRALHRAFWGKDVPELVQMLRRGQQGIGGFCAYMCHCIQIGVPEAYFHGKMDCLLDAMQRVSVIEHGAVEASTPAVWDTSSTAPLSPRPETSIQLIAVSHAETNTCGDVVEIPGPSAAAKGKQTAKCNGFHFFLPDSQMAIDYYPIALHSQSRHPPPWTFTSTVEGNLMLRSHSCNGRASNSTETCSSCESISSHSVLLGIIERALTGIHEKTLHIFYGPSQLISKLERQATQINTLKLGHLADARKYAVCATQLNDHKRVLRVVASGQVQNVDRIIRSALKAKCGILGIMERLIKAYHSE